MTMIRHTNVSFDELLRKDVDFHKVQLQYLETYQ